MSNDELKSKWLKRVEAWPTKDVENRGVELTIQALNRDQVMKIGELTAAERECQMIAMSIVAPFTVTPEEVQGLREGTVPLDLEDLTREISKLSGLDKKPKEAQNAAFKSVRDGSGTGVRVHAGSEAGSDSDGASEHVDAS